jgi:predicted Zn-dependent peptidase
MTRRNKHAASSLVVSLALTVSPAATAFADKETPPPPAPAKGFQIPAPRSFTLPNGLQVTFVSYGTMPKVSIELAIRAGNAQEAADQVWMADLTGDLMREGTKTRTAVQIAEAAARMGGSLDVAVGADTTRLGGDVLSEFGPELVELVADVAMNPSWPAAELPRLKADRARQLSVAKSQPQPLAQEKFRAVMYGDHPYGRSFPDPDRLQAYSLDQVRAFYAANFGAGRSHLYVAGRFDAAPLEAAVRRAFAAWQPGPALTEKPPTPSAERSLSVIDRPGAVQSTVIVGMSVADPSKPDYVPLSVTQMLLGGYFSSRITANIREQKGYTYSPFSQISSRHQDAYWAEQADVTTAVTGASLKEILGEIDRLRSEPPSASELKAVQSYMAGTFVLRNSTRAGILAQLEFVDLHGLPPAYLNEYVARVSAVTPADVQRMARTYIQDDKATIVVVGDKKVIEEQLAPYTSASGR